jgi:hypothetical protein
MAIPGNMWIYDDGGALIKGGCDVEDREFSIEFIRCRYPRRATLVKNSSKTKRCTSGNKCHFQIC